MLTVSLIVHHTLLSKALIIHHILLLIVLVAEKSACDARKTCDACRTCNSLSDCACNSAYAACVHTYCLSAGDSRYDEVSLVLISHELLRALVLNGSIRYLKLDLVEVRRIDVYGHKNLVAVLILSRIVGNPVARSVLRIKLRLMLFCLALCARYLRHIDDVSVVVLVVAALADNEAVVTRIKINLCLEAEGSRRVENIELLTVRLSVCELLLNLTESSVSAALEIRRKLARTSVAIVAVGSLIINDETHRASADVAEFLVKKCHNNSPLICV